MSATKLLCRLSLPLLACALATPPLCQAQSRTARIEEQLTEFEGGFGHSQKAAADALLLVDPQSVESGLRKRIARAFREEVLNGRGHDKEAAIRGLVHWAGKYSMPVLVQVINESKLSIDQAVFDTLIELDDPEGAEAVAGMLGNFFNHDEAIECLKQMGATAEPVVINAAKSRPGKMSMGAIEVLGEIGSEKGLATLARLAKRGPAEQRSAAKLAQARLRGRLGANATPVASTDQDSDDPFAEPTGGDSVGSGIGSHPDEGDWSQVAQPLPDRPTGGFTPDPSQAEEGPRARMKPTRLPDSKAGTLNVLVSVGVARDAPSRVALVTAGHMGKRPARGLLIDLKAGKVKRTLELPPDTAIAALSPAGKRLATLAEEGTHGARMRIDVWDLPHKEPKLLDSWRPFRKEDKMFSADPMWAAWVDEDRLLMQNRAGDLVLWDAVGATARMQWDVDGWTQPALSPGGSQVAAVTPDGVVVFDVETGDTVAWIEGSPQRGAALAFDASGALLACVNETRVRVWDLASGSTSIDFNVMDLASPHADFSPALGFDGADRLIVRGWHAVDVIDLNERRVTIRGEHSARGGGGHGGTTLIAKIGHSRSALYPEAPPAKEASAESGDDPDEWLAIGPGSEVSLDVRVGDGLDAEVRKILSAAIEKAGLTLADNAPNKFVARKETKTEVVTYRGFHTPHWVNDGQQVNVNEKVYTVTLFVDGDPAWRYMAQQKAQHMLHSQGGESFQQASDRALKASASYFEQADLPRRLVHPKHSGPLKTVKLRGD